MISGWKSCRSDLIVLFYVSISYKSFGVLNGWDLPCEGIGLRFDFECENKGCWLNADADEDDSDPDDDDDDDAVHC